MPFIARGAGWQCDLELPLLVDVLLDRTMRLSDHKTVRSRAHMLMGEAQPDRLLRSTTLTGGALPFCGIRNSVQSGHRLHHTVVVFRTRARVVACLGRAFGGG